MNIDDSAVRVTCFGVGKKTKAEKASNNRPKDVKSKRKKGVQPLSISPLSSMSSDEAIKAHRMTLEDDARTSDPQQIDLLADLAQERAQRQSLEEQLAAALNVNAEMKLALALNDEENERSAYSERLNKLKSQLKKERKEKEEMAVQLSAAKREAAAMRAALNAARTQRDSLEAELMEAALDLMDGEKQRASLQSSMKHEKQMRQLADTAMAESEQLRAKLSAAEAARNTLEAKMQAMTLEARDWEVALDALQDQLETALLNRPLESIPVQRFNPYMPQTPPQGRQEHAENGRATSERPTSSEHTTAKLEPWRQVIVTRPPIVA